METQQTITAWADEIGGKVIHWRYAARRAIEEMHEFEIECLLPEPIGRKVINEAADVVIILYRLASVLGYDLQEVIDRKMEINHGRKWLPDGTGHAYHIKEEGEDSP